MNTEFLDNKTKHPPHVSVIVPLYNRAQYCTPLLHCISAQSLDGIELIVVDDGSNDGGPAIIEQLFQERTLDGPLVSARLLHQAHAGPGSARNLGLLHARGEYVFFLDSDDLLPPNALSSLYAAALADQADVVIGRAVSFNSQGKRWLSRTHESQHFFRSHEANLTLTSRPGLVFLLACTHRLIRRTLAQQTRFPPNIRFGEDQPFMLNVFLAANGISVIRDTVYLRRVDSQDSLSRVPQLQAYHDMVRVVRMAHEVLKNANASRLQAHYDARILSVDVLSLLRSRAHLGHEQRQVSAQALRKLLLELTPQALHLLPARALFPLLANLCSLSASELRRALGQPRRGGRRGRW